ncbi:MAG TPA: hypothetical protein VEZ90_04125 [Blastocatellia bacterium]|nr:hypothetical protein [Blastocatellia bacterium]
MKRADPEQCDRDDTLYPSDMWADVFDNTIAADCGSVHLFAQMMLGIKQAIQAGPEGAARATNSLTDLINELFVYSATFKAARSLWILSLEGRITAENEPERILTAAIERGLKETMAARTRDSRTNKRRKTRTRTPSR